MSEASLSGEERLPLRICRVAWSGENDRIMDTATTPQPRFPVASPLVR
jgi:hypothetical protein